MLSSLLTSLAILTLTYPISYFGGSKKQGPEKPLGFYRGPALPKPPFFLRREALSLY